MAKKTEQLEKQDENIDTPPNAENTENYEGESQNIEPKKEEKQDDLSEEVAKKLAQKENKYNNLKAKYRELLKSKNDDSENESDKKSGKLLILAGLAILGGGFAFLFFKKGKKDDKNTEFLLKSGSELKTSNENSNENSMSENAVLNKLYGM